MADPSPMHPKTEEFLLEQLKDIELPAEVSWWPPAPGWWLVAALILSALVFGALAFARRQRPNRYRREARNMLDSIYTRWCEDQDDLAYMDNTSALLRQISIARNGRDVAASLTGKRWIDHLSEQSEAALDDACAHALTQARYAPSRQLDIEAVHSSVTTWLGALRSMPHV